MAARILLAATRGSQDWADSGTTFTLLSWTVLAGGFAVWSSRLTRSRTIWLAGLPCVALGAMPTAIVAVDLLFLLPR
ncbi:MULTISPECIES: hypothetical protein [Amycolatopsis]|uniref:Uncharacterized protein n=1 Tax=Amycolatopsis bullii TaxID=941987 RepID=A0ABQ3KT69_9PSEU|nr:hypothetical protein [Amycolatopsis bullii]GHG31307.1 hypothetical protein GCM10017567_59290 [Amycolatopsis bullii]